MDRMSDPKLPHGQLPPIPDGCGMLPIAENRIARGPHPELLDVLPEGFEPVEPAPEFGAGVLNDSRNDLPNDAMEQSYRRVLARALALAAGALLLTSAVAATLVGNVSLLDDFANAQVAVRLVLISQVLFLAFCGRYVEKLSIAPAAVLLFAYSAFSALEFAALLPPAMVATAFLCAGLMYGLTALWGLVRGCDLAHPATPIFMILGGGAILATVNKLLGTSKLTWTLCSVLVVIFGGLLAYLGQAIRDFYQDFDDDNAQGWKASVLGALLLVLNLVNVFLLFSSLLSRELDEEDSSDDLPR
jgi:FtsH-binding integral membrane protein